MIRKWLMAGVGAVSALLVVGELLHVKAAHNYSHVPLRSAIIPQPYPRMGQAVDGLVFSPDGRTLIAADTQTGMSLWSLPELRCKNRVEHTVGDRISTNLSCVSSVLP